MARMIAWRQMQPRPTPWWKLTLWAAGQLLLVLGMMGMPLLWFAVIAALQ